MWSALLGIRLVAASCETDPIGIHFGGLEVKDNTGVHYYAISGDLFDEIMEEDKDGVGAGCIGGYVSLFQVSKFFAEGTCPSVMEDWVSF